MHGSVSNRCSYTRLDSILVNKLANRTPLVGTMPEYGTATVLNSWCENADDLMGGVHGREPIKLNHLLLESSSIVFFVWKDNNTYHCIICIV